MSLLLLPSDVLLEILHWLPLAGLSCFCQVSQHGKEAGLTKPAQYYYATGSLSAVLDNAPTYLNFLKLAEVTFVEETPEEVAGGGDYDKRGQEVQPATPRVLPPMLAGMQANRLGLAKWLLQPEL